MKKKITGVMAILVAMITITGCEKETVERAAVEQPQHVLKSSGLVEITATPGHFCGTTSPCGSTGEGITSNNSVNITNDNPTDFPSLVYTFYRQAGSSNGFVYLVPYSGAQYQCNALYPKFAKTYLPNHTGIMVLASPSMAQAPGMSSTLILESATNTLYNSDGSNFDPGYTYDFEFMILGYYKGLACGGDDPIED